MNQMAKSRSATIILVADNNQTARNNYRELLSTENFSVLTANSPQKARYILDSGKIDLALIDWRLDDNEDENDDSGLQIARDYGNSIPIILMTFFNQEPSHVREVFLPDLDQAAPVDFFLKERDTLDDLLAIVHRILSKRKVFVIHGHNQTILEEVKTFLAELSLEVVVLREQPAQGRTIIENLLFHSDVFYAVALLTDDDVGRSKTDARLLPRARQNVILELGLFLGQLGRHRVSALVETGVEIPSDLQGVIYISLHADQKNDEEWKEKLEAEIRSAGIL